ncbi:MAG: DUF1080 domain-containing protein [Planctomycetes bacterium]|nr:DUF1080 domain-containing protein [Planctomycetota bacterium]
MRTIVISVLTLLACVSCKSDGWVVIFDGKSTGGWKANENVESWSLKDGLLVANGPRSHLFYVGDEKPFVNFELEAEVMTQPNSNSGIYFHTKYQDSGWPKYGFEVQVNNSHPDPQRTGGLYGVAPVPDPPSKDGEWFTVNIRVEGKNVKVAVNGQNVVDYTEPEGQQPGADFTRVVDEGTFALQAHDPESTVSYRKIKVRRLP